MGGLTAKMLIRSIRQSFTRYLAIMAIVALGVGFFAGLKASTPAMRATASEYLADRHMYDYKLLSTLGFTAEDVAAFQQLDGVAEAEGIYFTDALAEYKDKTEAYRFMSLNRRVAMPALLYGRLPETASECLADAECFGEEALGSRLTLTADNTEDVLELLPGNSYTIVGIARSPEYISKVRGSTSLGNGTLQGFIFVPEEAFVSEALHGIQLWCDFPGDLYSGEYNAARDAFEPAVNTLLNHRAAERRAELMAEAQAELEDARAQLEDGEREYADGVTEAAQELADGKQQLEDAEEQVRSGRAQLAAGKAQLADGRKQIAEGRAQITENRALLTEKEGELSAGRAQLDEGWTQYRAGLAQAQAGRVQLDALEAAATSSYDVRIAALKGERSSQEAMLAAAKNSIFPSQTVIANLESRIAATDSSIAAAQAERQAALDRYSGQEAEYAAGMAQLNAAKAQLDAAEAEYAAGKAQLDAAKAQLDDAEQQLNDSEKKINEAEAALPGQEAKLNEAEKDIAKGWQEYEDGVREAEEKLADGRRELDDAWQEFNDAAAEVEKKLDLTVYTLTRTENHGLRTFESDSGVVDTVSDVFPLFFVLIAALVCVTTMTRMVNEERTQIGTLKAMGVPSGVITAKYLLYSGSAALIGCGAGFFLGTTLIPYLVWYAYGILYNYSKLKFYFSPLWNAAMIGVSLGVTLLVTWLACRRELREKPAELVRPKAPANGKRILLERIGPLWNRMSFLSKVTLRSALRRPVHIMMMLLGVGGCTALLLIGFGVINSVSNIGNYQYDEIFRYDVSVNYEHDTTDETAMAQGCERTAFVFRTDADASNGKVSITVQAIAAAPGALDGLIALNTEDGSQLEIPGAGEAIVTQKVADTLGLKPGAPFRLHTDEGDYELTVSGIAVNYIHNYVYTNDAAIQGETNYAILAYPEGSAVPVARLMGLDGVNYVSTTAQERKTVEESFDSLDLVMLLLVGCSAALAFIVICNLTNIAIMERMREIATVKVLGFRPRETAGYILKENTMLSVVAAGLGLYAGVWMFRLIMLMIAVEDMTFDAHIAPESFVYAYIITIVFAAIANLLMRPKLERVNMAESLKSVE